VILYGNAIYVFQTLVVSTLSPDRTESRPVVEPSFCRRSSRWWKLQCK